MKSAAYWIKTLGLQPHPEGGWFRQTYRSRGRIPKEGLPDRFPGSRAFSTAIYFLLEGAQFSAFHRIRSDEMWHFYAGRALVVHVIGRRGKLTRHRLGPHPDDGDAFQVLVPAGAWFAAEGVHRRGYALVGCTVAPGFDFADFELGRRKRLLARFPPHAALIERLSRPHIPA